MKASESCGVCRFTTQEAFMAHRNARLTFHGRRLLVLAAGHKEKQSTG